MSRKIAASGLGYGHLETVFFRDGADALVAVLREQFQNKPRVANEKKILNNLIIHFQNRKAPSSK